MLPTPTRADAKKTGLRFLQYHPPHDVYHPGVDFNYGAKPDADLGQEVFAPAWGIVVYVSPPGTNGGLGNYVVLSHPQHGAWTRYLHLETVAVAAGQAVTQYEVFGTLGDEGTTTAHLHFEVLNGAGLDFIRDGDRPYGRYPRGLSKQKVAALWLDPDVWLRNTTDTPMPADAAKKLRQAEHALKFAKGARLAMLVRLVARLRRALGGVS